tara:strand:- start:53 stop:220 length:168 start_codon:yes stop_codon:yes gene_type:complete
MFGIFRTRTKIEKLQIKYKSIINEAYTLSKISRKQSDEKYFEADQILKEINKLKK